jgi:hypothetical protein
LMEPKEGKEKGEREGICSRWRASALLYIIPMACDAK